MGLQDRYAATFTQRLTSRAAPKRRFICFWAAASSWLACLLATGGGRGDKVERPTILGKTWKLSTDVGKINFINNIRNANQLARGSISRDFRSLRRVGRR